MDGATMQALIYQGYGIAAQNIGLSFDQYRPSGANAPTDPANKLATLPAHFRVDDKLSKWSSYGKALYSAWVDGRELQVGDYLVGVDTYFIAGMQPLLPILAVQCSRTLSISRPSTAGTSTPLMTSWPASLLEGSARGKDEADYPGYVASPQWVVLLPAAPGVTLGTADIITDDLGRLYFIESAELTDYGWRLKIEQTSLLTMSAVYHYATVIDRIGKSITIRHVSSLGGANPALNPVGGAITVYAGAAAGVSALTLTAPLGNWFLVEGDSFTLPGDATVYTVTGQVVAAGGVFASVPVTPTLAQNVAAGAAVTMTWANDYPTKALVSGYDAKLIDGTTITLRDLRVVAATTDTNGRPIPTPVALDKVIIDGVARPVGIVSPMYAGDVISVIEIQAKG